VKLASLKSGGRDGTLVVVSRDLRRMVSATDDARSLQQALDNWPQAAPRLADVYDRLNADKITEAIPFDVARLAAPLPRAYQWLDGSAFLNHMKLMRKARGAELPPSYSSDPVMYQGASDTPSGPVDPILLEEESWNADFEAELAVVVTDVPMRVAEAQAGQYIRLFMLANDVSFAGLERDELAKGMGFVQSKPSTAFSPVAVTPDEFGRAWDGSRVDLTLETRLNGSLFGNVGTAEEMEFGFPKLIAHAAKTRRLICGTTIGSGTVSNSNPAAGCSSIGERRAREIIATGKPLTPFLRFGDTVRIEMRDTSQHSIFGAIVQTVTRFRSANT